MKAWIAFGSNLGDRRAQIEAAAGRIQQVTGRPLRTSPLVQTPALVPDGAALEWNKPFLNGAAELEWTDSPQALLKLLKNIEVELGRTPAPRWAPRAIDLDLLLIEGVTLDTPELQLPHSEMWRRQFVLTPLKHLSPRLALTASRALVEQIPLWMSALNFTPDSFADRGEDSPFQRLERQVEGGVNILDLGGESTRPGATPIGQEEEWARLEPALAAAKSAIGERVFRPWISVDTFHAVTARRALANGVDILNDVSGLEDPEMLAVLRESNCQYVLMHNLGVPVDSKRVLPEGDPIAYVTNWAQEKLIQLERGGISFDRVIFDPGLGFGKTAAQSWALIRGLPRLRQLPVRLLLGHSRKSFLKTLTANEAPEREPETLGVSLQLAQQGADILRVHHPLTHARAFHAFQEARP